MNTTLDELLSGAGRPSRGPVRRPALRAVGTLVRALLVAAAGAGAVYGLAIVLFGVKVPYALLFVVLLAAVLGRDLAVALRPPPRLAMPIREETEARHYELPDRPFVDALRWESRLEWLSDDGERFARTVVPALAALADERLRQAHGITRASDPERARQILGWRVCQLLDHDGRSRGPSPREMAAIVDDLEAV